MSFQINPETVFRVVIVLVLKLLRASVLRFALFSKHHQWNAQFDGQANDPRLDGGLPTQQRAPGFSQTNPVDLSHHLRIWGQMDMLIANAQIVLLPGTFQSGIKLKLMYSLFRGRHIITSPENLSGTGLTNQCWVASTKQEYIQHIYALFNQEFETEILEQRSGTWPSHLSNRENVSRLITTLFNS